MSDSEYVVVEVEGGAIVGEIPDGASVPHDVCPDQEPFTVEQAEQVAENLNEAG